MSGTLLQKMLYDSGKQLEVLTAVIQLYIQTSHHFDKTIKHLIFPGRSETTRASRKTDAPSRTFNYVTKKEQRTQNFGENVQFRDAATIQDACRAQHNFIRHCQHFDGP